MTKKNEYIGFSQDDRDRLIRTEEKLESLKGEIQDMKDGSRVTIADHEMRLRFIERYIWIAMGSVTIISFALNYFHPFAK